MVMGHIISGFETPYSRFGISFDMGSHWGQGLSTEASVGKQVEQPGGYYRGQARDESSYTGWQWLTW